MINLMSGFSDEMAKLAGILGHAAEVAGLGILAAPSVQRLRGKPMAKRREAGTEVAGLGLLAAPSAYHLLKRGSVVKVAFFKPRSLWSSKAARKAVKDTAKKPAAQALAVGGAAYLGARAGSKKEKTAGGFDRAARLMQEAKGVVAKVPTKLKTPGSVVRGMPMTGKKMHGLDRAALEPAKLPAVGTKIRAMGA